MDDRTAWFRAIVTGERRGVRGYLWRAALWWARLPYGVAVLLRNRLYDAGLKRSVRVPAAVVSVGNLTLGGTGKTPCVEWVARLAREHGRAVAVVSRGYGVESGPNDEALVLEDNLPDVPHLQDRDRVAAALAAVQELESDLLLLDDGFQHRRLARDLDIVLVDLSQPFDDYLFPRGFLREPLSSLRRAGLVIATHGETLATDPAARRRLEALRRRVPAPVAVAEHAPLELVNGDGVTAPLEVLRGRPAFAFCGIGNPDGFRRTLAGLGVEVAGFRAFADHHPYTRDDVAALARELEQLPPGGLGLTTQKDSVKLRVAELGGRPLWAVRVGLRFLEGEDAVRARLAALLDAPGQGLPVEPGA